MLSRQERIVIGITAVYTLASTMVMTFANVYLLDYTGSLLVMTQYVMFRYAAILVAAFVAAKLSSRLKYSYLMSTGLILITSAVLVLLGVKSLIESERWLLFLVGTIMGAGEGFFWIALNTIVQVTTTLDTRLRFISINGALSNFTTIIAPFLSSLILSVFTIELQGYYFMFLLAILLFVITAIMSFFVRASGMGQSFSIRSVFGDKNPEWRRILRAQFLWGVREAASSALVGMVVYTIVGSGSVYGNFLGLFAMIATTMQYLSGRIIHKYNAIAVISFASMGVFLSGMSIIFIPTVVGVLLYGFLHNISYPLASNGFSGMAMNVIGSYQHKENLIGRSTAREITLGAGRLFGFVIVLLFSFGFGEDLGMKVALVTLYTFALLFVRVLHYEKSSE